MDVNISSRNKATTLCHLISRTYWLYFTIKHLSIQVRRFESGSQFRQSATVFIITFSKYFIQGSIRTLDQTWAILLFDYPNWKAIIVDNVQYLSFITVIISSDFRLWKLKLAFLSNWFTRDQLIKVTSSGPIGWNLIYLHGWKLQHEPQTRPQADLEWYLFNLS